MAARCAPWSMTVTSSPASANLAASRPPMAPAPTTQIFFCLGGAPSRYGLENIAEAADAIDHDLDDVMGVSHGAGAERGAAGDDVARHQRHVLGNRGDESVRREKHVGDRIILPLLAVQDGLDRQLHW